MQVLAQPGSFYVASAFSLAVNVIDKKMVARRWDNLTQGGQLISPTLSSVAQLIQTILALSLQPEIENVLRAALRKHRIAFSYVGVA